MLQRISALFRHLSTLVVMAALAGIGLWGHEHDWDITTLWSSAEAAPEGQPETGAGAMGEAVVKPSVFDAIEFGNADIPKRLGIEVEPVRETSLSRTVDANGVVDYDQTAIAQLSVKVPGTIFRVEKTVGKKVKRGDILVIAEAMEVGRIKADFLAAVANRQIKLTLLEIVKPLTGVVAVRQLKEAEAAVQEAEIRVYNSHQALLNLGLVIDLAEARSMAFTELNEKIRFLGLPPDVVASFPPGTTTANLVPIVAPFDGTVIGRNAVVGEVVSPDRVQFTIADMSKMWILLDVRGEDADRIMIGQPVRFQIGESKVAHGEVNWISTEIDQKSRTLEVRAEVKNPIKESLSDGGEVRALRANAYGIGTIRTEVRPKALVVQRGVIQQLDGEPIVFVSTGPARFEPRRVTLGVSAGDLVEVSKGLAAGDAIVVKGSRLLHSELTKRRARSDAPTLVASP